jgi:hypothetical protein
MHVLLCPGTTRTAETQMHRRSTRKPPCSAPGHNNHRILARNARYLGVHKRDSSIQKRLRSLRGELNCLKALWRLAWCEADAVFEAAAALGAWLRSTPAAHACGAIPLTQPAGA